MMPGPQILPKSKNKPEQLVVFLHGYGANGDSLIYLGENWSEALPDAEFIAPHGLELFEKSHSRYGWFPWIDFDSINVRPGLEKSAALLAKVLNQWLQKRSLLPQDLAVVGFSQGMMVALELMFHLPGIRAIIGYSGAFYPPLGNTLGPHLPSILLVHGDADAGVPYSLFGEAGDQLRKLGLAPQLETRPGLDHQIDPEGIQLGKTFLQQSFLLTAY
jgi:phospholipase/carboxylesterase